MKTLQQIMESVRRLKEDAPTNNAGSGAVAGLDIHANLPPARPTFAGHTIFDVDSDVFFRAIRQRPKYKRMDHHLGNRPETKEIHDYLRANPTEPIIVRDRQSKEMVFLRR